MSTAEIKPYIFSSSPESVHIVIPRGCIPVTVMGHESQDQPDRLLRIQTNVCGVLMEQTFSVSMES